LELEVFTKLPLVYIDISNNTLPSFAHIMDAISNCKSLETLVMANSTKTKDTSNPRDYAFKVCKQLRNVLTVDGLKNPFGTMRGPRSRAPATMQMAEALTVDELAAVQQEENESAQQSQQPVTQPQPGAPGQSADRRSNTYDLYGMDLSTMYKDVPNIGTDASWEILYRPRTESMAVDTPGNRDSNVIRYG